MLTQIDHFVKLGYDPSLLDAAVRAADTKLRGIDFSKHNAPKMKLGRMRKIRNFIGQCTQLDPDVHSVSHTCKLCPLSILIVFTR